ncbi:MAG TPA: arginase [Burkholderiales bacterium]|nr:arginase [Burkholderiales bacterium]
MAREVEIISAACGVGAGDPGTADAPEALWSAGVLGRFSDAGSRMLARSPIRPGADPASDKLGAVARIATELAARVHSAVRQRRFPLVIGGDHSIAIGTWSGVSASFPAGGRLGLIWIDAHLDSHTFDTTPSRNLHGMPLACLLGHGEPELTGVGRQQPKVLPPDLCVIGARSFEPEELGLLQSLGVRIFFMPEIRSRGVMAVFEEAVARVTRQTFGFGLSFDVDVFDPSEEPGTGLPVAGGLFKHEVLRALAPLRTDPRLLAMEIVEYNPHRDTGLATAHAVHELISAVL